MKLELCFIVIVGIWMVQALTINPPPLPLPLECQAANTFLSQWLAQYSSVTFSINDNLPMDSIGLTTIQMFVEDITITGLDTLRLDCPASKVDTMQSTYVCHLPIHNLTIDFSYYNMSGTLDTVDVYGEGTGYIKIDNFTAAVFGPTDNNFLFTEVALDLWIYRWTVEFQGIMPGTDMGYLFNEFLSMVGPETIDAIDTMINNNYSGQLLKFVNMVVQQAIDFYKPGVTKPTTTTAPLKA